MKHEGKTIPVIVVSGNATLSEAARAIQIGSFDFIEKPFTTDRVLLTVKHCLENTKLRNDLENLVGQQDTTLGGNSLQMERIRALIRKVAASEASVLVRGESGTGKELVAQMVHDHSARKNRPFIKVNCSAMPENLIESELFGHERGAFTGAAVSRRGYFELADRGTIFLDEIGDMPLSAQAKVLRALQNSEVQKVGSEKAIRVNVRVIAATHKDLEAEIRKGRFREDLYYRLNVVPLFMIPLREHPEDIPELSLRFIEECCRRQGCRTKNISTGALAKLKKYHWPGNVRELRNLIERAVILGADSITELDLPSYIDDESPNLFRRRGISLKEFRENAERDYLIHLLREHNGNISRAAKALGIGRTHLHKKLQTFEIAKREYFV